MKSVCFVVLHYGDISITDICIRSILRMNHQERIHIILVDNEIHMSQEQRRKTKERYISQKNITVIPIMENGGFSYANNVGYQYAKGVGSDFIVICNNDIEFLQEDFVELLYKVHEKHQCHILSPDIIHRRTYEHQSPMDQRIRTYQEAQYTIRMNEFALKLYPITYPLFYLWNKRLEKKKLENKRKKETYYQTVQNEIVPFGACLIITSLFMEKEDKAFEPETRFYYEEYMLALRCQRKDYLSVYDPVLKVVHESGEATRKSLKSQYKRTRFVMQNTLDACKVYLDFLLNDDGVKNT